MDESFYQLLQSDFVARSFYSRMKICREEGNETEAERMYYVLEGYVWGLYSAGKMSVREKSEAITSLLRHT